MTQAYRPLDLLIFVGIMAIWGGNFAAVKIGLEHCPPILLVALRFMIVALLLVPLVKVPRQELLKVFGISVTLGLLHFSLMFTGLTTLDAATAAIAIQLQVPFAAILAAIVFKDMLGWRRFAGMTVAFAGILVIAGEPRLNGQYLALGMVVAAACIWSVANVQIKLLKSVSGTQLNAWLAVFSTPQLLLASFFLEDGQWEALAAADWRLAAVVLYQSVCVVVLGYGAWYWLLGRYQLNQAMPFMLLVPLAGVLSGVFILGESLTLPLTLGGLLTVAGVAVIILRRPRVAEPSAERL